jgi:hypothetical protein
MSDDLVSFEEIEIAYKAAAIIVQKYGDSYIHTFKRLHEELESRKKGQDIVSIALRVAAHN